jgi:2-keto-4-pentenoate hydratase/2-oxohepta-3-ene-1,7-dioic acid hydratase in catechol pathway
MPRWIRFSDAGATRFGTLEEDVVRVHEGDMFGAAEPTGVVLRRADVKPLRPVEPGKVIVMYNNFGALLQQMKLAAPAELQYLLKPPNTYLDPGAVIPKPSFCDSRIIFEGELGVVIGRRCKDVPEVEALSHVFGYTCANDVTAADVLTRDPSFPPWARAKGFDGFCPFGPVIGTGLVPETLEVRTFVNGSVRQHYPLSDMLFSVPQLVSGLSRDMTLNPGDLILCGTSSGVGVMRPGNLVEIEIEGIGRLSNRFETEPS